MRRGLLILIAPLLLLVASYDPGAARAADAPAIAGDPPAVPDHSPAATAFFEKHIRPLLITHCYECHSEARGAKVKGGLRLDHRDGWVAGGDSGPAIVPGDLQQSLLITAIHHKDEEYAMPPKGKLDDANIKLLEQWVSMGAPDPRTLGKEKQDGEARPSGMSIEAGRRFWAFVPPRKHEAPAVKQTSWPRGDIDRFVLARLEAKNIQPLPDADPHTLLRRLSYDLTGMPATPAEQRAFLIAWKDDPDRAVEQTVDRMLASPRFGERWGRHWLDIARYADSNGGGVNFTYDNAWRYRDYVIAAFNHDKPYDLFVREQIAGDLLPARTPQLRAERQIATGFLLVGPKPLAKYDKEALRMDVVDEQIDAVGQTFMGLTLGCARCHDHKFDPVPTEDYYALAGIFRSTYSIPPKTRGGPISTWTTVSIPAIDKDQPWYQAQQARLKKPTAMAVTDEKKPRDQHVRIRGLNSAKGKLVKRGALQALQPTRGDATPNLPPLREGPREGVPTIASQDAQPPHPASPSRGRGSDPDPAPPALQAISNKESGRKQLAWWLTRPNHPLTARVMVNRVWHHLMGQGIVASVDNFGVRGRKPSHPQLLDTLAVQFVESGWSVKRLVRRIANSRAYRLATSIESCDVPATSGLHERVARARSIDPENDLCWRGRGRRLDVESIRDTILTVSGQLDAMRGGPTLNYTGRLGAFGNFKKVKAPSPMRRRGVYLPIVRDGMALMDNMDMLETFDFTDPSMVTGHRASTTVPTQALYLMNSPFMAEQAKHAAEGLLKPNDAGTTDDKRVRAFFAAALGRPASDAEVQQAMTMIATLQRMRLNNTKDGNYAKAADAARLAAWTAFCQAIFSCNEFLFVN